jgi:hypothetical protein
MMMLAEVNACQHAHRVMLADISSSARLGHLTLAAMMLCQLLNCLCRSTCCCLFFQNAGGTDE